MSKQSISDDQALEALLSSAQSNQEAKDREENKRKGHRSRPNDNNNNTRWDNPNRRGDGNYHDNYHGRSNNGNRRTNHDFQQPQSKKQRRWNSRKNEEKEDSKYQWGDKSNSGGGSTRSSNDYKNNNKSGGGGSSTNTASDAYYGPASNKEGNENENETTIVKDKPNFGLSGALAEDERTGNTYNGIVLKFSEPPEARTPNTRWRLYVFKKKNSSSHNSSSGNDDGVLQTLHISRQSAYLFGRERKVADIPVDHPSLSKQHCVIQYRSLPDKNDREQKIRCKPYLMDLGSTNGTFINGVRIDDARYYELRKGDVITLGASSREYVLLTENTTSSDL
jgi:smad nuclear-interacting protein 1